MSVQVREYDFGLQSTTQVQDFRRQSEDFPQYLVSIKLSGKWVHVAEYFGSYRNGQRWDSGMRELVRKWEH